MDLVDFDDRNKLAPEVVYLVVNFLNFLCEKKEKWCDLVYVVDIVDAKRKPPKIHKIFSGMKHQHLGTN